MTDQELKFLTEVDFIHHVALGAITDLNGRDKLIGGGRYVAYDDPGKPYFVPPKATSYPRAFLDISIPSPRSTWGNDRPDSAGNDSNWEEKK